MADQSDVFDMGVLRNLLVESIAGNIQPEMELMKGDLLSACLLNDHLSAAGVRLVMKNGKPEYVDADVDQ